jgi:hypothetical protein
MTKKTLELTSDAALDRGADDLHALLRELALIPFLSDRPDATAIGDRVALGEELSIRLDLKDGDYSITQGNRCLQSGVLAKNEAALEIIEAAGAVLATALNQEPEGRRKEIALQMDGTHLIVGLRIGSGAEAVMIQLGEPSIFSAARLSEVAPELHLTPDVNRFH